MNTHRNLVAWQACRELTREVYRATAKFPSSERFGLTSQLRRAAISTAANIAEGFARSGVRETSHGLSIALGSLAEVDTLLTIAADLGYLTTGKHAELEGLYARASKCTFGLFRTVRARSTTA